jgi:hypothetical protein
MRNSFDGDDLCHGITITTLIAAVGIALALVITIGVCVLAIL